MKKEIKKEMKKEDTSESALLQKEYKKLFGNFSDSSSVAYKDTESLAQPPFYQYVPTQTTASPYQTQG